MKKILAFVAGLVMVGGLAWATVESVTYISDLNTSNPAAGDAKSEGDDHIRNLKTALRNTFPNITGAVTATHTQLSYVTGVTSAIQTQIDAKAPIASPTLTGTPAAPTAATGTNTTQIATTAFVRQEQGLVLLATASASSSATIDFLSGIDSTFAEYELHFQSVIPATSTATLNLRISQDGSTFVTNSKYDYGFTKVNNSGTSSASGASAVAAIVLTPALSSATGDGGTSGIIRLYNPASTASDKLMTWSLSDRSSTSSNLEFVSGGGVFTNGSTSQTSPVLGLRLLASSGNIASGTFKLYGVRKS
jgi:hypothetical protein